MVLTWYNLPRLVSPSFVLDHYCTVTSDCIYNLKEQRSIDDIADTVPGVDDRSVLTDMFRPEFWSQIAVDDLLCFFKHFLITVILEFQK